MLCQCVLAIDLWTPSYRLWRVGWEQREYHESALNRRSNTSRLCQAKANCACRYGMWLFGFIHPSCQSRIFLSFFPSLPTWNCRKSAETLPHRTFKLQHTLLETVDLVTVPRNFWHWRVSDIDHRQIGACCACSKCGTLLFAPLMVIVLWPQYREKIAQHMLRTIAVLHFPIYALKSCPAPAALAAGAVHYFSLTAYNLTFKPPYRGKGLKKDISWNLSVQHSQIHHQSLRRL